MQLGLSVYTATAARHRLLYACFVFIFVVLFVLFNVFAICTVRSMWCCYHLLLKVSPVLTARSSRDRWLPQKLVTVHTRPQTRTDEQISGAGIGRYFLTFVPVYSLYTAQSMRVWLSIISCWIPRVQHQQVDSLSDISPSSGRRHVVITHIRFYFLPNCCVFLACCTWWCMFCYM